MESVLNLPYASGVYIIICTKNNKFYIGSTGCLRERFYAHCKSAKNCSFDIDEMNDDVKKYGEESFVFNVLCTCNLKVAMILERYYIKKYKAIIYGYNRINAPSVVNNATSKYMVNPKYESAINDKECNLLMEKFLIEVFDIEEIEDTILISLNSLYLIAKEINNKLNDEINIILHLVEKLDLDIFLEHNGLKYIISGKQIFNLFNTTIINCPVKTDINIDENLKKRICIKKDLNNIYIEFPKLKEKYKSMVSFCEVSKFKKNNEIIDLRYTYVKNPKDDYLKFYQYY